MLGAAITAGPEREAGDPETILRVNLLAQTPILIAARAPGVRRVINLSSAAAYGASAFRHAVLDEETPCDPVSLYAITKFASEKVAARLAALWQCDIISVRLSAVFGPWERSNDVRDTPSPQAQILAALQAGARGHAVASGRQGLDLCGGCRGSRDVADRGGAAEASALQHLDRQRNGRRCNGARNWPRCIPASSAGWRKPAKRPRSICTVRPIARRCRSRGMAEEFGWRARFGCADSAADLSAWWTRASRGNLT